MFPLTERRRPILCYVTDRRGLAGGTGDVPSCKAIELLLERIERAAAAGIDWIQIREKDLSGRELSELVRSALWRVSACGSATHIFVNDRLDIALATGAQGVHLGENAIPIQEACRSREDFFACHPGHRSFLIGASCHSLDSALAAARAGADYIYFGPVFSTPSKLAFGPPQGLDLLAKVCTAVSVPVVAIGGISLANASDCLATGASGVAAIRLFQESKDLSVVLAALGKL